MDSVDGREGVRRACGRDICRSGVMVRKVSRSCSWGEVGKLKVSLLVERPHTFALCLVVYLSHSDSPPGDIP